MILGIVIGVVVMILIVLAFAVGYGMADQKHNKNVNDDS